MHYAYLTGLTPRVISAIQENPNVHLDLPLQHSHPEVLRAMKRPWQGRVNDTIIERIKTEFPHAILRTTFMVDFPAKLNNSFNTC